jgi:putative intracellular protease/amidase
MKATAPVRDFSRAQYLNKPVVRDRNLITSCVPGDLPMFSRAIKQSLVAAGTTAH